MNKTTDKLVGRPEGDGILPIESIQHDTKKLPPQRKGEKIGWR